MVTPMILGVLVPFLLSLGLILLFCPSSPDQEKESVRVAPWVPTGSVALSYLVTHAYLVGWPDLPFIDCSAVSLDAKHWIFWGVLAALGSLALSLRPGRGRFLATWLGRVLTLGLVLGGTSSSQVMGLWSLEQSLAWLGVWSLGGLLFFAFWDLLWERGWGRAQLFFFVLVAFATSLALFLGGSLSLAQLLGALALAALTLSMQPSSLVREAGQGLGTILGGGFLGFLWNGQLYLPMPGGQVLIFLLASQALAFCALFVLRLKLLSEKKGMFLAITLTVLLSVLGVFYRSGEPASLGEEVVKEEDRHWDGF